MSHSCTSQVACVLQCVAVSCSESCGVTAQARVCGSESCHTHVRVMLHVCCSVLQCVAVCGSKSCHRVCGSKSCHTHVRVMLHVCCSVLQCVAVCCSVWE